MQDPAEKGMQQNDAASSQWGQSLCWICQEVTAAWYQQAENCLEYLILPAYPDTSVCQKQSWYMT